MTLEAPRLLMIGLDALPPELLERWCDDGSLPNLAALRKEATYGYVDSPARYLPGSVWPTFNSGSSPSVHGVYHFMQWDPATMSYMRPAPDWVDYESFWYRLGAQGVPTVAFDLPFCYQKQAPPGVVEAHGWGLHDELSTPFSNPATLLREVQTETRSALRPDVLGPKSNSMLQDELRGLVESVEGRVRAIEHLAKRFDWRLFLTVFAETHRAGHYFWGDRVTNEAHGGLRRVAMAFDAVLPRLRALAPEGRLVVFSLHGMGGNADIDRFSDELSFRLEPRALTTARRFDPVTLLHRNLPSGLRRAISASLPTRVRDRLFTHYLETGQDWSTMRTLMMPPDNNLFVRANLAGRERDGILSLEEASRHLDGVAATLRGLTTARGVSAVREVARSTDVFEPGPRYDLLPDVVVVPADPLEGDTLRLPDGREVTVPWRDGRDGAHRATGFYIHAGPESGSTPERIAAADLARRMCETVGLHF